MRRRTLLAAGTLFAPPALAQPRTLRLVVPYPPGGSADVLARAIAEQITAMGGRSAIVENRAGASGTIGALSVARAAPDGTTILQADGSPMSILLEAGRTQYRAEDFAPLMRLATSPFVLATRPNGPLRTLADVIAAARAAPGRITYATPGVMSFAHVVAERFAAAAGIELLHVPFQGTGPATSAVLGGQVELIPVPPGQVLDQGGGAIFRPIAITTEARHLSLPETPTFREAGVDLVFLGWRGMFLPAVTPPEALVALEQMLTQAMAGPIVTAAMQRLGEAPAPLGPRDFTRFWAEDRAAIRAILPRLPRE
ncbi:tripartite tricarboxylate transporter substrate binding protein [Sediminicoccus rosea]|uniref:Tripartite tricarboxylate transporter substrate binding protein n=1 Tax=Sediminicoccus rosea TaxID=1225128 RepID=A0ABZ0PDC8_9PROT|nr:tripartite tricarboxylate transporter substrate binding protein [Sediminicoccus rosea]WPB83581.1 tripartite tricarboxylate transporter substrate binding protein [Sediminicoccus rosea]